MENVLIVSSTGMGDCLWGTPGIYCNRDCGYQMFGVEINRVPLSFKLE